MRQERCDWRARIGVLSPICNPNLTSEWTGLLPKGVTFHEALMGLSEATPDEQRQLR